MSQLRVTSLSPGTVAALGGPWGAGAGGVLPGGHAAGEPERGSRAGSDASDGVAFVVALDDDLEALAEAEGAERAAAAAGDAALRRLDVLATSMTAPGFAFFAGVGAPIDPARGPDPGAGLPSIDPGGPEAALLAELFAGVSFTSGAGPALDGEGPSAVLARLTRLCRVETLHRGAPVATTRVGWGGATETVVAPGAGAPSLDAHARAVALAVAARHRWLRTAGAAVGLAGRLAAAASHPGGPAAVLPAVWRFVAEVRRPAP